MNQNQTRNFCCFYGADGQKLHAVHYKANKSRGIVLLVHGRNELNLKYEETCIELMNLGMDVYAYDHRFQGFNSRPYPDKEVCHIDSFMTYVADLERVINQLPKSYPLFIMAVSMGGAVTLLYLMHNRAPEALVGAIFVSPLIQPIYPHNPCLIYAYARFKYWLDSILLNKAKPLYHSKEIFKPRIFGVNANTHDEQKHNKYFALYEQYPQCRSGMASASWILALQKAVAELAHSKLEFKIPTLFLLGTDDKVVDPKATEKFVTLHDTDPVPPILYRFGECYHDILIEHEDIRRCVLGCLENFIQGTMRQRLTRLNKDA